MGIGGGSSSDEQNREQMYRQMHSTDTRQQQPPTDPPMIAISSSVVSSSESCMPPTRSSPPVTLALVWMQSPLAASNSHKRGQVHSLVSALQSRCTPTHSAHSLTQSLPDASQSGRHSHTTGSACVLHRCLTWLQDGTQVVERADESRASASGVGTAATTSVTQVPASFSRWLSGHLHVPSTHRLPSVAQFSEHVSTHAPLVPDSRV
mmetsp:Transcript_479/g.1456  ORF Transcript_479/g.1456 Transcript_479/m.1456 type:complete len:207 (+) Transcript_479:228-848(+)